MHLNLNSFLRNIDWQVAVHMYVYIISQSGIDESSRLCITRVYGLLIMLDYNYAGRLPQVPVQVTPVLNISDIDWFEC